MNSNSTINPSEVIMQHTDTRFKTDVLPISPTYIDIRKNAVVEWKFDPTEELDYRAICFYLACGFFLGEDTFYKNVKVVSPCTEVEIKDGAIKKTKYWQWHNTPREIRLNQAVEEFSSLFEKLCSREIAGKKVILPISGGLDSRTQAAALSHLGADVSAYSYQFENGINEVKYAEEIAKLLNFPLSTYTIPKGYLWEVIEELASLNNCFAEFTHPRSMTYKNQIGALGDIFHLGHMGDALFDNDKLPREVELDKQIELLSKKILKKGGAALATDLWQAWGLPGSFKQALTERLYNDLEAIDIKDTNARLRAFKSLNWVPRWTSANMKIFTDENPVSLPYYQHEMCEFICTLPEDLLAGRQIQIEYLKRRNPSLAKVSWQDYHPYNLYNYPHYFTWRNLPRKAVKKIMRTVKTKIFNRPVTMRNWELQFLGPENDKHLRKYLFENQAFKNLVPDEVVNNFYGKFKNEDQVFNSHPVSMLLTMSVFSSKNNEK